MKPHNTETRTCDVMLPEMVDVGVAEMAEEKDLRAAVAEARRVADLLHAQDQARGPAPQGPAWPVEPGSLAEAVYWFRQLAGQGEYTRPEHIIAALSNLGYSWRMDRRWAEAEAAFREGLQLRQQHGDRFGVGQTLFDLAGLYQAQERWADAEQPLTQSLEIARELGDRRGEATALGSLGFVYAALGQTEKALHHLQQAVAVAGAIPDEALAKRLRERMARINGSQL